MTEPINRRALTEQHLVDAVGKVIREEGFKGLGINRIAKEAGCDKVLIYRYFGSIDGLIGAFLEKNDLYAHINLDELQGIVNPTQSELSDMAKLVFNKNLNILLENKNLQEIYRWELIDENAPLQKIAQTREKHGYALTKLFKAALPNQQIDAEAYFAVITAAVHYLVLRSKTAQMFNGLDLHDQESWKRVSISINKMIEHIVDEGMRKE
jgi:AcrR family transcriptional regulator